jgi:uncharacterized protein YidB (DUF937 family)
MPMGLLDNMLGNAMGGVLGGGSGEAHPLGALLASLAGGSSPLPGLHAGGNGQALLGAALGLLQQHGGLPALLEKLTAAGLGQQVQSWVGTGANLPVTGEQLHQALGSSTIGAIASQLGVSPQQAGGSLAQLLPEVINHLTPAGQVPGNHAELVSQGLALLKGFTG